MDVAEELLKLAKEERVCSDSEEELQRILDNIARKLLITWEFIIYLRNYYAHRTWKF
jgi:hypothetical protein